MIFNLLTGTPYPWIFFTALFTGSALSSLTRRHAKAADPEKAREYKGFFIALSVTLAIIFLLCAIFVPGPEKFKDINLFFFFLIVTAVFFPAFRFKKAAGIPFLLLAVVAVGSIFLFLQAVVSFTGETEIAKIRVLSAEKDVMKFELSDPQGIVTPLEMPGTMLGAEVKEIIFDDFFVFFGARTAYRFVGLKSSGVKQGSEMTQELRAYELAKPTGISEMLYQFFSANQGIIPGIKAVQVQITYVAVKPLATYSIRVQHDSGVEIMRLSMAAQ